MNLTHHVTSLELSRRLKEMGVPQVSFFYWVNVGPGESYKMIPKQRADDNNFHDRFSAFLASELGEMMAGKGLGMTARTSLGEKTWWCSGGNWIVEKQKYDTVVTANTEADARAKLLIRLIEQGIVIYPPL